MHRTVMAGLVPAISTIWAPRPVRGKTSSVLLVEIAGTSPAISAVSDLVAGQFVLSWETSMIMRVSR
jgi:hypothetical protein